MKNTRFMASLEKFLPESDKKIYLKRGLPSKQVFGNNPALLIVDVTRRFVGSKSRPVLEAIEEYRSSCGEIGWKALPNIKRLQELCHTSHIPVIFTTGDPITGRFSKSFGKNMGATKDDPMSSLYQKAEDIPEAIMPSTSDLVIRKTKASAFWETPLLGCLNSMGVDTLLVGGVSTSGCVRASVVDAYSHGFRCFIVEECTFDRFYLSHLINLFDMDGKYADVISLDEALKIYSSV